MKLLNGIVVVAGLVFSGIGMAGDKTIWLQAGQCILIGSQQVCSARSDSPDSAPQINKQTHICKNGIQDEADPNLKGWGMVVITTSPDGKKIGQETIKTYGPLGKKACEAEVKSLK